MLPRRASVWFVVFAFLVGLASCDRGPRGQGDIPQEVYVWQRDWNGAVIDAVTGVGTNFSRLVVLAGEVGWRDHAPRLTRVEINYDAFPPTQRSAIGLALRIAPYPGPFDPVQEATLFLRQTARDLIREAAAHGIVPAEFQLDFDCAESRLEGYRVWVETLRAEVAPVPLVVTTLPSWLDNRNFAPLVHAADGFVLQVHSLARPRSITHRVQLCDPPAARRAVEKAGRLGVPFRVALPTYGYRIAFATNGSYLGASAEGPTPNWPVGTRWGELLADPVSLARLVADWTTNRPARMNGVIWYRLPVETDRLNWRWPTLASVMAGRPPRARLAASLESPGGEPHLREVQVRNDGNADYQGPVGLRVRLVPGEPAALDGVAGFTIERAMPDTILFTNSSCRLRAETRQIIGWVRFATNTATSLELLP